MDGSENKKELSEEDIKARYITPALNKSGWSSADFRMELKITDGRINMSGNRDRRERPKFADYLLYYKSNYPIAIVEAKDNKHTASYGLQQAIDYARKLDVPFCYSSNGDNFVEHDFLSGMEREVPLDAFPTKDELVHRLNGSEVSAPTINYFLPVRPVIDAPFYSGQGTYEPRYYQRVAINRTINAVANGQDRILLVMATGTGKTYTAFQIVYRLLKSNTKRKILYLADRNILVDQSIEQDFRPLEKSIHKINFRRDTRETIGAYDVYFSLYQQLADRKENDDSEDVDTDMDMEDIDKIDYSAEVRETEDVDVASRLEQLFTPDYFDLIIVDECHRGSAKEASNWRKILEYFSSATQIGMTATPKETEDVSNIGYFGEPVYTYSLKEGIEDGFLAPFKVIEETTNITNGWRPYAGQVDSNGHEIPDREYTNLDFDTNIVLEDRTREVAEKITNYLKTTNRMQKTIVFCPTEDAADRMRNELAKLNSDMMQQNPDYIVRITGGDPYGKNKLDYFISVSSDYPVIATTSKLLSTGVDCKMVKLIVLDEVIGSMTEFKQIIGRGTRLREVDGKTHFVVMDFRGNTKQFADPNWDGPTEQDKNYQPGNGRGSQSITIGPGPIVVDLDEKPIVDSDGCKVQIINEEVKIYDFETGKLIRTENIGEYLKRTLRDIYANYDEFKNAWFNDESREELIETLNNRGIDIKQYKIDSDNEELDDFDLLNETAYGIPAKTRLERSTAVRNGDFITSLNRYQQNIVNLLLNRYTADGISEIKKTSVLKLNEFEQLGSPVRIVQMFGGEDAYHQTIKNLIGEIYKS